MAEQVRRRQLSERVFGLSDLGFGGAGLILFLWTFGDRASAIDQIYGWETPRRPQPAPCLPPPATTGIPLSDHIASRAHTMKLTLPKSGNETTTATLTQLLLEDAEGRLGWLFSLRGAIAFDEKAGSAERPVKITFKVEAKDGLDAVVKFSGEDRFTIAGTPSGSMSVAMAPAQPVTAGPAFALPDSTGTRLEIGDFAFKTEIAKDGLQDRRLDEEERVRDRDRRGRRVREGVAREEGDARRVRRRADRDAGRRLDRRRRTALDHALAQRDGRAGQAADDPARAHAESRRRAARSCASRRSASFTFDLGSLRLTVEQIGATVDSARAARARRRARRS